MKTLLIIAVVLFSLTVVAQQKKRSVVIGSMTNRPNALLIVNPENSDQGVLLPQLSTGQRISMKPTSPTEDGLIVYDTHQKSYFFWSDGKWMKVYTEPPARVSYSSIDPVTFRELKSDNGIRHNNTVVFESDNTFVTASQNAYGEKMIAPLNLPHGADLQELTLYFMDNDDDNLKAFLIRKSHSGSTEEILNWESSGSSATVETAVMNNFNGLGKIDLENYTYRIVVEFEIEEGEDIDTPAEAKQRLYGVKLKYQE